TQLGHIVEAGGNQCMGNRFWSGCDQLFAVTRGGVAPTPLAPDCAPGAMPWHVSDVTDDDLTIDARSDRNRICAQPVHEVDRSIDRIDDPIDTSCPVKVGAFFADESVL